MGGTLFQPVVRGNSRVPIYNWRLARCRFGLAGFGRLRNAGQRDITSSNLVGLTIDKRYDDESAQEGSRGDSKVGGCED